MRSLLPLVGRTEAEPGALSAEAPERLGSTLREAYTHGKGLLFFVHQLEELLTRLGHCCVAYDVEHNRLQDSVSESKQDILENSALDTLVQRRPC